MSTPASVEIGGGPCTVSEVGLYILPDFPLTMWLLSPPLIYRFAAPLSFAMTGVVLSAGVVLVHARCVGERCGIDAYGTTNLLIPTLVLM